VKSVTS